ncbi:unnamed protein product, partial [Rotaria sp. Silwood1]
ELEAIAVQWNINDLDFYLSLRDWFRGRRLAEQDLEERRYQAQGAAA